MTDEKGLAVSYVKDLRTAAKAGALDVRHWSCQAVLFHLDALKDWTTLQELVTRIEGGKRAGSMSIHLARKRMPQIKRKALANNEVILTKNGGPHRALSHLKLMDRGNEGDKREAQAILDKLHRHGEVTREVYNKIARLIGLRPNGKGA